MSRLISLSQGLQAIIDDEDYDDLVAYSWFAHKVPGAHTFYAVHSTYDSVTKKGGTLRMHRLIMGQPDRKIDHIDRNGLNNQRSNLRLATTQQNAANSKIRIDSTSGYKGVSWRTDRNKWRAYLSVDGGFQALGHFDTPEEAALAYNDAATRVFGEFALLNTLEAL